MVDPQTREAKLVNPKGTRTIKTKSGIPLKPIIVDKASWGSGWSTAGKVGMDKSGALNWMDFSRSTRDYGADYALPKVDEVEPIELKEVDSEALEKIKAEVGAQDFNTSNYNYYTTKNGYAGIIAMPKDADIYLNSIPEGEGL